MTKALRAQGHRSRSDGAPLRSAAAGQVVTLGKLVFAVSEEHGTRALVLSAVPGHSMQVGRRIVRSTR